MCVCARELSLTLAAMITVCGGQCSEHTIYISICFLRDRKEALLKSSQSLITTHHKHGANFKDENERRNENEEKEMNNLIQP